jgi:threonine dehydratase
MSHHEQVILKCENFQRTGSFKIRGATNAVLRHRAAHPQVKDFVTHSSGNHGQALALAAAASGCQAHIVIPDNAPASKVSAVTSYGGKVYFCRPTLEDREKTSKAILAETKNSVFIHPYDDEWIIAGQGTIGVELLEQTDGGIDAVVVPVGGGGLCSGVALAVKGLNPRVSVYAAEPLMADDTYQSFSSKKRVARHREGQPNTIADGLRTLNSDRTFEYILANVDGVLRASEDEIRRAMKLIYERCKLVIEPSAAVGVAVVLARPEVLSRHKRVAIVICGGNVDLQDIPNLIHSKL